ncbi:hypothetical protein EDB84DRAFT_1673050 [Lactarius hengduanensis]|nr:hypothetical protein EDB84DRAFT_1673050 [Lactarius hengduanensis]
MGSSTVTPIIDTISDEYAAAHRHTPPSSTTASSNTDDTSNKDDSTQSDANDVSNGTNDVTNADIETMKRESERYVSRSPPYNPAVGNKVRNPPRPQGLATDATYRSSGAPGAAKGRPPAVTANAGTTAQPKRNVVRRSAGLRPGYMRADVRPS